MNDTAHKENTTLAHYKATANAFWQGTKEHDVSQNIDAFLNALPKNQSLDILDLGCGPGRDLKHFKSLGHRPVGFDGCETFCQMAEQHSACPTINQTFSNMALEPDRFDGVFANASLFHVPSEELLSVLKKLRTCLREGGILFSSNPRGNSEGWQGERYGNYMQFDTSRALLQQAGFKVLDHYYRPAGQPIELQPWLAIVSQRC